MGFIRRFHRSDSILVKILAPLLAVMLFQSFLVFGMYQLLGISAELKSGAFNLLKEKTSNEADRLVADMKNQWGNVDDIQEIINIHFSNILNSSNKKADALASDKDIQNNLLRAASSELIYLIGRNHVSGAFLILNTGDESDEKPGVYFKVSDDKVQNADMSDITIKAAPGAIAKKLSLTREEPLKEFFKLTDDMKDGDYYFKPYMAAVDNPDLSGNELGYWSYRFPYTAESSTGEDGSDVVSGAEDLKSGDTGENSAGGGGSETISGADDHMFDENAVIYSQPLSYMGVIYGVFGVVVEEELRNYFLNDDTFSELSEAGCGLIIGEASDVNADTPGRGYLAVAIESALAKVSFYPGQPISLAQAGTDDVYTISEPSTNNTVYAVRKDLDLYPQGSPFSNDDWSVLGFRNEAALLGHANKAGTVMLLILLAALLIGVAGIIFVANMITKPIGSLARELKLKDPNSKIALDKLGILEIDELSDAIEGLSTKVADVNRKLADILEMAETSIAVFEYHDRNNNQIIYTKQFAQMFDLPVRDNNAMELRQFLAIVRRVRPVRESVNAEGNEIVYKLYFAGRACWVRFLSIKSFSHLTGVITDVTKEMEDRKRLEHERDFDILTDVFNRRAFNKIINSGFDDPGSLMTAAIIMLDLDNLKSVNDAFGHDYGDKYIRLTADTLRTFSNDRTVVARLAGDEFIIFLFGYDDKDQIREICEHIKKSMKEATLHLPDGTKAAIQISAGIAWYPDDSRTSEELIRFADFAMYMVKKTNKGQFKEFDYGFYNKHSYLRYSKNELDQIIDNELIGYQFQPIINASDGEIFAYEALMRPKGETIQDPAALVSLARAHSRLPHIEKITFFKALEEFSKIRAATETDCKLFVNSIASQFLGDEDLQKFAELNEEYMGRIVVEITEDEKDDDVAMTHKLSFMRKHGQKLALDDFGVGYSNESIMLNYSPDFIKIDMSLIRNIHEDENRKSITSKLIAYGKNAGIVMLAEGVEVKEEMEYLIGAGIDLLQGFYICRPMSLPPIELPDIKAEIAALKRRRTV